MIHRSPAVTKPSKIKISALTVGYPNNVILRNFSLEVSEGEVVCLVGASGCGKSTLLNAIAGLIPIQSGCMSVDGMPIKGPGPDRVMVFQEDAVFPWMRVYQNVEFGLRMQRMNIGSRRDRVAQVLKLVELDNVESAFPRELSGGMKKRVDLARALAVNPEILLMDEPYGALDAMTKERLQIQLLSICERTKMTTLFVTHDLEEALFLGDKIVVLSRNGGQIAKVVDVPFEHPRDSSIKRDALLQRFRGELSESIS